MNDQELLKATARDERTVGCPLCDWTRDVPPVPVSDALGAVFGLSGQTLAMIHAEQEAKRTVADLRRHLSTHPVDDWLTEVLQVRAALSSQMWAEVQEVTGR